MTTVPTFAPVTETVTQTMIDEYAALSGDFNPLHVDPVVAAQSEFGGTIAHGPISLQVIFRSLTDGLAADALPAGTRVSLTYRAAVRPGDEISSHFEEPVGEADGTSIEAGCTNQDGATVVSANVVLPNA